MVWGRDWRGRWVVVIYLYMLGVMSQRESRELKLMVRGEVRAAYYLEYILDTCLVVTVVFNVYKCGEVLRGFLVREREYWVKSEANGIRSNVFLCR
jgi:hypothetical protein